MYCKGTVKRRGTEQWHRNLASSRARRRHGTAPYSQAQVTQGTAWQGLGATGHGQAVAWQSPALHRQSRAKLRDGAADRRGVSRRHGDTGYRLATALHRNPRQRHGPSGLSPAKARQSVGRHGNGLVQQGIAESSNGTASYSTVAPRQGATSPSGARCGAR